MDEHDWLALVALESGAVMNSIHSTARGLVAKGLAYDSWGRLEISEEGRKAVRSKRRQFVAPDGEHVADMSGSLDVNLLADPMANPAEPLEAFNWIEASSSARPEAASARPPIDRSPSPAWETARPGSPAQPPPRVKPGTPLPDPPPPVADLVARLRTCAAALEAVDTAGLSVLLVKGDAAKLMIEAADLLCGG